MADVVRQGKVWMVRKGKAVEARPVLASSVPVRLVWARQGR